MPEQEQRSLAAKRVKVSVEFVDGTSSDLVAEDPTGYSWNINSSPPVLVYDPTDPHAPHAQRVQRTLRLDLTWDEPMSNDGR
jgi:hypothetical protein